MGSAAEQGPLWGAAVDDWMEVCEPWTVPLYAATLAALAPLAGRRVLDAGCGSGQALMLAADAGARVTGLDAAEPMVARARTRLPEADLRVGEIQDLPFGPASFDVAMSFNTLQYAASPAAAVDSLARVVAPGGRVAVGMWGDPARCDTETVFAQLRSLLPPRAEGPSISTPGAIEDLLEGAALTITAGAEVRCPFTFPDLATGWRGQSAVGPFRTAIATIGPDAARAAYAAALEPFRQPDGSYRQENVFRYVIAAR
ncbi:hypothetical protein Ais01nite_44690 [Asanoa ishikariensis]|uniref:Methyltransferase domain-containing protein n=1 Tax=Asanoa ishikariensis TaxID=137265 RepID=A0A1H3S7C8_9ACTN|nr:class I SAM-dependent methyltransferase [Asanoa ishikariensis]GIF66434.1 hypothetical protein Ais01nite_44690 [Asanoa ishikariensis]SDZ33478.1 Methyltransferase domain-containing protein [Asanoa ishikariensis]